MTNNYNYSTTVINNFLLGFSLFLLTEILIFIALFWAWIYTAVNPSVWIGSVWPPIGIQAPNPLGLPLYSTFVLFTSSCALVWFEMSLQLRCRQAEVLLSLILTIGAGIHFLAFQILEFTRLPFSFTDSIYGNLFYSITGLHFLHILVGLSLLLIVYYRIAVTGNNKWKSY